MPSWGCSAAGSVRLTPHAPAVFTTVQCYTVLLLVVVSGGRTVLLLLCLKMLLVLSLLEVCLTFYYLR